MRVVQRARNLQRDTPRQRHIEWVSQAGREPFRQRRRGDVFHGVPPQRVGRAVTVGSRGIVVIESGRGARRELESGRVRGRHSGREHDDLECRFAASSAR